MPVSTGVSATDSPDDSSRGAAQAPETAHRGKGSSRRAQGSTKVVAIKAARSAAALKLDLDAVAHVEGLAEEVAMLRASIRELAHPRGDLGDLSEHVKILAELRHQVEALCSTLKAYSDSPTVVIGYSSATEPITVMTEGSWCVQSPMIAKAQAEPKRKRATE